ncbi:MAG: response regulator [Candidatus Abyssobacteria bacterium SURF_5]|uniref:histidine kinase n=1 Tax=Abyssobacteria bacterium (strain SURF_5) TaxID=2093360 RepID=A0A3A4NGA6_ABYX5|nr:MAG: response regulator [Candidatus Abyssubacteria bacterium SURF_5]
MDVVVIASNENSIQESLRMLLGERYMVLVARSLPQLINIVNDHPVDVVILDEFLGAENCAWAFDQLRSVSPEITCIVLALQTISEAASELRAKGAYDIVSKPFDREVLLTVISRAVERSRLMARLAAAKQPVRTTEPLPFDAVEPSSERKEMLDSLRRFLRAVTDVLAPERLHALVLDAVVEMFSLNKAVLLLWNEEKQRMVMKAAVGLQVTGLEGYEAPWKSLMQWLHRHDQILNLDDPAREAEPGEMLEVRKEMALLQGRLCVPLTAKGKMSGVLVLGRKITGKRLSDVEIEFLYLLSQQIAAIIENARHHRAVLVQKERYKDILQGVTSGLIATDAAGRLLLLNKAAEQILKVKAADVTGHDVQRIGSMFADIVNRTLREGKSFCRHEVTDPATKALLGISTSVLTDDAGKPVGAVALFTDLSTVKSHAGMDVDEAWQRCALCMAQEIKNPLVAIRTFTQLFPQNYADEKFRTEFAQIALKEIDKLDAVVEKLLKFSQPLQLRPEQGNINNLIEEALNQALQDADKPNVVINKNFETANGIGMFDRNLLGEAFVQVFRNALDSMPSGGTLNISAATRTGETSAAGAQGNGSSVPTVTEICISDSGSGIAPEDMGNLFKPFYSKKVKGMGLGLAISRKIIQGHKGDISVLSEPNRGTTVKVVLPHGA